jgi:hypothetical protein
MCPFGKKIKYLRLLFFSIRKGFRFKAMSFISMMQLLLIVMTIHVHFGIKALICLLIYHKNLTETAVLVFMF